MKTVLFVCVHNAGRSQMAEGMLNHLAKERGVHVEAHSAGTVAGKSLNPLAVQAMEEAGIPLEGHHPKLLNQHMADSADLIISMGCGVEAEACPARFLLAEDWALEDPAGQPIEAVRRIREEIRTRVVDLLDRLEANR